MAPHLREDAQSKEDSEEESLSLSQQHSSMIFFSSIPSRSTGCAKEVSGD